MICYLLSTAVQLSDVKPNVTNDNRRRQSKEPIRIRKDVAGSYRGNPCENKTALLGFTLDWSEKVLTNHTLELIIPAILLKNHTNIDKHDINSKSQQQ